MIQEWDILRKKCPKLYKDGIHFECGIGWYNLIHDLSIKIEHILNEYSESHEVIEGQENEYIEMHAIQVKEKYGTLRFYMSSETNAISELIHEAEMLSSQTCENCGEPAKMRGNRWLEVRCDQCYKEKK